jgi:hypothetical protein
MSYPAKDLERIDNHLQQITVIAMSNPSFLPEHRNHIGAAMEELSKAIFYPRPPGYHWDTDLYLDEGRKLMEKGKV